MSNMTSTKPQYSIIVALEDPREGFSEHIETILRIIKRRSESFELLIIANGTETFLRHKLSGISNHKDVIRAFILNKKVPQAVCLKAAFKEALGEIIIVFGSYQQITEESFDKLLGSFDGDTDILSPWRSKRVDPGINQVQSSLFNWVTRLVSGSKLHDLSCTVKIFRREVLEKTKLYGNMYRFLPILAELNGFRNKEVKCDHFKEYGKVGYYGISVYFTRFIDVLTLFFTIHFTKKPLRLFSSFGLIFSSIGGLVLFYVLFQKIFWGIPVGGRAVLILAILFIVLGIQFFSVGLLGEIVAFTFGRYRKEYSIRKII